MLNQGDLNVAILMRNFPVRIAVTWFLVLLENVLWALVPLLIGHAIDGLLADNMDALWFTAGTLAGLTLVAMGRRAFDTRAYGTMRVHLGKELIRRIGYTPLSRVNARLDMARELVDFLEAHVPELLTGIVQLIASIVILLSFDIKLGGAGLAALVLMAIIYSLFHRSFYIGNSNLNEQTEQQVSVLETKREGSLADHLLALRRWEVKLSDTEALMYGLIFLVMSALVVLNLLISSQISGVTAGMIFSIISYTWELVESSFALPVTLQQWTRLSEIKQRLNKPFAAAAPAS